MNGYKIANPTLLARITHEELEQLLRGYGWTRRISSKAATDPAALMHEAMATAAWSTVVEQITHIQEEARVCASHNARPRWPMIVLEVAQGLDGAKGGGWFAD